MASLKGSLKECPTPTPDDCWACSSCGSDAIDEYQQEWCCLDCGAVWYDATAPDWDEEAALPADAATAQVPDATAPDA